MNRLPTGILNFKTPIDTFINHETILKPTTFTLDPKIFGCMVFVHIPKHDRTKFSPCAVKCVFLGYGVNQKGYRCYDPLTKHMYTTMNCDFVENEYYYSQSSGQGESQQSSPISDPLNWLETTHQSRENTSRETNTVIEASPPEPVDHTNGPSHSTGQNVEFDDTDQPSTPSSIPEVNDSTSLLKKLSSISIGEKQ